MESRATRDWIALVRQRPGARTLSRDVAAELADHLEDIYMSGIRAGRSEADAVALAIAELDQARFDELIARPRATRPAASRAPQQISPAQSRWWTGVQFDLRDALRSARRQPAFTVSVIAILGIAIGAATAAFSVMDAVLWRPLPYPAAGRLIVLTHMTPAGEGRSHAAADWRDYAARHEDMAALAAYSRWPLNLTGAGEPQRLHSVIVSGNFFDVLGRPAALGRTIRPADDTAAADPVVVVSRQFWLRQFGGDPSVVGRQIVLNARAATIVGIMPGEFAIPDRDTDIWMPMGLPPSLLDDRGSEWLSIIGRLRRGVDLTRVQSAMDRTAAALAEAFPATNAGERENLRPLLDDIVGPARRSLWLGALAVAIVLLGGCANAASLMIARATLRRDEIAIRSALGAEPLRIARQLLVESVLLAGAGGALGVGLAFAVDRAFLALADGRVPRIEQLEVGGTAVVFAILVGGLAATVVGGGAARVLIRRSRSGAVRGSARVTATSRVSAVMLAAQVAFAVILAAGATLVARAYAGTHAVNPGFDVSETLTLQLTLPRSRYATAADHAQFAERALEELTSIPVVASAGVVSDLPFVGNALHFEVRPEAGERTAERMTVRPADPGFFRTLRVPVESGRLFDRRDRRGAPAVAIVNRTAANRLNQRGTIGARLVIASDAIRTVVGIVGDIKHEGLRSDEGPVVYVPFSQSTFDFQNWMGIVIRGSPLGSVAAGARAAIARVDPDQPLAAVRPMSAYVDEQLSPYRFGALVVLALAAAALTLAVTGIYGMTAFIVGRRIRELGIRLALGATRRGVIQLVLKQVAVVVALGSGVGVAAAMITNRLLQTALADAPTLSANAAALAAGWALLIGTAAVAAVLPARRAARIDPRSALEAE